MKNFFYLLVTILFASLSVCGQDSAGVSITKLDIRINMLDTSIRLNDDFLISYKLKDIEAVLGKPDRIKTHIFNSYYEEFGTDNMPKTSTPIVVKDYYYIYDQLGIMFYTSNGLSITEEPERFSIHFKNKRMFTNTRATPFSPENAFKGILKINGVNVSADKKILPEDANYQKQEIKLFNIDFGPTSISTVIDGLYSISEEPYIFMYLDNEKEQRISYIVVY
jgi:hypothetical protein